MIVCIPITPDDHVGHSWGRAAAVAIADVDGNAIKTWERVNVSWDSQHDEGSEGTHHARVARFLKENKVDVVAASHMGDPMANMIRKLRIRLVLGAVGDARTTALAVAEST